MNLKISIIIAVYNTEKYLEKCIDSVLKQTMQDFELILVNDGSTDGSAEIIEKYSEKYSGKIISFSQENSGQAVARNRGMKVAKGKYVTFLDSDDYIKSDYLETLLSTAEKNKSDVVCSGQYKVKESGEIIKEIRYKARDGKCLSRRLNISGKLYRMDYLKKWDICFPEGKLYEDNSFNFQALFLSEKAYFLDYSGYYQVVHVGSTTSKPIRIETLPLIEWKEYIKKVKDNCSEKETMELFEFTMVSFFTYFLLVRNRKREYINNNGERADKEGTMQLAQYCQETVNEFFEYARHNKYATLFKYRELEVLQRVGTKVFAWICYFKKLVGFTGFFYKLF